jgi:hypothetical protein
MDELRLLTHPLDSTERLAGKDVLDALGACIDTKLKGYQSPNGQGCIFWVQRTCWDVVHTVEAVEARNLITLARELERVGLFLMSDQVAELYKKIVKQVFDASLSKSAELKKLKRADVLKSITDNANRLAHPAPVSGTRVAEKMDRATLTAETIQAANHTRWLYRQAILRERYSSPLEYTRVEGEVVARLSTLLNRLDTGDLTDDGPAFHTRCQTKLEELYESDPAAKQLGLAFLHGCMYNITDRCGHRFLRVTA